MQIDEFRRIVFRLANRVHCRYWLYWNYPNEPQVMALHICDYWQSTGVGRWTKLFDELDQLGFLRHVTEESTYWLIERSTSED